jgi:tRNA-splicing ligase RtcB (3'-phosphate/5'-hydroxy nucleic acid ligase)
MTKTLTIFGKEIIDDRCITQLENCLLEDSIGVLTPDAHYGYAHPIGGAVAYKNHISVSGVGFDIGCGNKAVKTGILVETLTHAAGGSEIPKIMDEIFRRISFGMGRPNNEKVKHEIFEEINKAKFRPQAKLMQLAKEQLGTVGGGNHFIDLFEDEDGYLWIGVHFGSRGFGHKTATGFIAMSQGKEWGDRAQEGGMDKPPILLDVDSQIGQDYIAAMEMAGKYAYAGRDVVVEKVLEILGNPEVLESVHNHHNFAWKEYHFGQEYWVVRKGCTPAFKGQRGFIGANMLDNSVIIEGLDSEASRNALYSTVHGAGRVMSRTEAAGKKKWIADDLGRKRPQIVAKGKVDFDEVRAKMKASNVVLRGAGADEAPECYKTLTEVLGYMSDSQVIKHTLRPIGVCMAGDEYDPYKD